MEDKKTLKVVLELTTIVTSENSKLCIELRFYGITKVPEDRDDPICRRRERPR